MAKHKRPNKPPAQKKPPLTHFLCLPLVTANSKAQLEDSLAKFRYAVTSQGSAAEAPKGVQSTDDEVPASVHPRAVRPVGALHCTLGVMSLKQDELQAAIDLLNGLNVEALLRGDSSETTASEDSKATAAAGDQVPSLQRPISPPQVERSSGPLTVDLKGLESMHAPQKTSVLYTAPSDTSNRLYNFCLAVQKIFKEKGLLVEDNRDLKLHATIVNTIYAKGRKRPQPRAASSRAPGASDAAATEGSEARDERASKHGPTANAPLKIDATQILEKYKDYIWAENVILDRVAICEMGAKKIFDEQGNVKAEEYTEVASIALPI